MLVGDHRWVVYGGETSEGVYLSDVHVLDTATITWSTPEVSGDIPPPRYAREGEGVRACMHACPSRMACRLCAAGGGRERCDGN